MHIRQLPSGRWRWFVQYKGRLRNGTADDKQRATIAASQALIELGADHPRGVRSTMAELLTAWLAERTDGTGERKAWSPTYAADMAWVVAHLPDSFLERQIESVTPPVVTGLHRTLRKQGWSNHRIGRAHLAVSGAFKMAVGYGWASSNPCRDLSAPSIEKPDVHAPDNDVVKALLAAMPERIALIVRLAAITGCRLGELCALRWIDLHEDTLTVRRAVVWTPESGLVVRDTTKTGRKGDRRLELDPDTLDAIDEHRAKQQAVADERGLPDPWYMFSHDAGVTPWRPGYVGLEYRRARATVPGAEQVRFHDLRHWVATGMLTDGEQPIDVAAQLGHSTPATTLRVYAHYLPGRGGEAARRRAGRLG